jgi:hypothetical protein
VFERIRAFGSGLRAVRAARRDAATFSAAGGQTFDQAQMAAVMAASEEMRAAVARGERPDTAAYMATLAANGMVMQPSLPARDPRLAPVDGLAFEDFVELVAREIVDPEGTDTQVAGFDGWSARVTADPALGSHYTGVLQARLAELQAS